MKKVYSAIVLLLALSLCVFAGCRKPPEKEEKTALEKRVSTYHDAVYVGASEDFEASFITGESEKLIVIDGEVGDMAPFATLTVTPLSAALFNNTYTYLLKGENGERTGDLAKDVVGASFSAEVKDAKEIGKILSLTVKAEGILESEVPLLNKLDGAITWTLLRAISSISLLLYVLFPVKQIFPRAAFTVSTFSKVKSIYNFKFI